MSDEIVGTMATRQLSIADLDGEHHQLLVRAITRILSTELAEVTYAQIIDGLPTGDVAYEAIVPPRDGHPIDQGHNQLCPGMLDKAREFRDGFQPEILTFDSQVSFKSRTEGICVTGTKESGDSCSMDTAPALRDREDSRRV